MEPAKTDAATNTNPVSQIALINKETKKKPYDVKIKNNNPNEPKIQVNMKYSDKQRFRRYKTKTEPKLYGKIMIDEEDDIVKTIKKAFGIQDETKKNYTEVETSGTPFYEEPNPQIPPEVYQQAPRREEAIRPMEAVEVIRPTGIIKRGMRPMEVATPEKRQSIATEITGDVAQPPPLSPGQMIALSALQEGNERRKKREQAAEAAKARLFELSKLSATEKAKGLTYEEEAAARAKAEAEEVEKENQRRAKQSEEDEKMVISKLPEEEQELLEKDPSTLSKKNKERLAEIKWKIYDETSKIIDKRIKERAEKEKAENAK